LELLAGCAASVTDEAEAIEAPLTVDSFSVESLNRWWKAPCPSTGVAEPLIIGDKGCDTCVMIPPPQCDRLAIDAFAQGVSGPVLITNTPLRAPSTDYAVIRHEKCGVSTEGYSIPLATRCRLPDHLVYQERKGTVTDQECVFVWLTHKTRGGWEPESEPVICREGECCAPDDEHCYKRTRALCL
jgi:hypothetical protein